MGLVLRLIFLCLKSFKGKLEDTPSSKSESTAPVPINVFQHSSISEYNNIIPEIIPEVHLSILKTFYSILFFAKI